MTEMAEPISIARIDHVDHSEDTCAFCKSPQKPTSVENDLKDDFDEDANETPGLNRKGMAHKNNAGKLGQDLIKNGKAQIEDKVTIAGIERTLPVQSAAHHVIPGNASLPESQLMPYLHMHGMATGNIGYNINNFENGVWLVGNYALRGDDGLPKWGPQGSGFLSKYKKDPYEYACAAIEATQCQFHDAHTKYSNFVKDTLNLIAKKMKLTQNVWCQVAGNKPDDPKEQQLFMLVNRLNTTSRRMKTMLENPGKNWKKNVFTSRFSEQYINDVLYKK